MLQSRTTPVSGTVTPSNVSPQRNRRTTFTETLSTAAAALWMARSAPITPINGSSPDQSGTNTPLRQSGYMTMNHMGTNMSNFLSNSLSQSQQPSPSQSPTRSPHQSGYNTPKLSGYMGRPNMRPSLTSVTARYSPLTLITLLFCSMIGILVLPLLLTTDVSSSVTARYSPLL